MSEPVVRNERMKTVALLVVFEEPAEEEAAENLLSDIEDLLASAVGVDGHVEHFTPTRGLELAKKQVALFLDMDEAVAGVEDEDDLRHLDGEADG